MFWTSLHCFFFFFHLSRTDDELPRVKLYREWVNGRFKYSNELVVGSSIQGLELPRVKLQKVYNGNPGSSYRESTVFSLRISPSSRTPKEA